MNRYKRKSQRVTAKVAVVSSLEDSKLSLPTAKVAVVNIPAFSIYDKQDRRPSGSRDPA